MQDWAERLRGRLGRELSVMTTLDQADSGPAFEETLGALFRWEAGLNDFNRFASMLKPSPAHDESIPGTVRTALQGARENMNQVTRVLNQSLFEEFGPGRLNPAACEAAYKRLLRLLVPNGSHDLPLELICATTNYDRSLELAFEGIAVPVRTGFVPHPFRSPQLEPFQLGEFKRGSPSVIYLHGAVGWYVTPQGFITSVPADIGFNETLGRPAVLYPTLFGSIDVSGSRLWECRQPTGPSICSEPLVGCP